MRSSMVGLHRSTKHALTWAVQPGDAKGCVEVSEGDLATTCTVQYDAGGLQTHSPHSCVNQRDTDSARASGQSAVTQAQQWHWVALLICPCCVCVRFVLQQRHALSSAQHAPCIPQPHAPVPCEPVWLR
jgi:hypothetical protein